MGDDITLAAERGEGSRGGPAPPKFTKIDKKVDSSKEIMRSNCFYDEST